MEPDLKELEEKYSKNKPTFSLTELAICMALIAVGCVVFLFMPDDMGIFGWAAFAIGTFLNVVGIFRLAAMIPEAQSDSGRRITLAISLVVAVLIQFFGLLYLYSSNGTGKGIAITTLTLCISLGLIIYVVDFDDPEMKKKITIACRIITVILAAIAIFIMVRSDFSRTSIYVGTILLIEAAVTGKTGFFSSK